MKKIFTLIAMAMMAVATQAQNSDLMFCYENGEEIPSGSVVVVNTPDEEYLEFDEIMFNSGIFIKNNTASDVVSNLAFTVSEMSDESELSVCLGTQCQMFHCIGDYAISNVKLAAGSSSDMRCHWAPAIDWDTEEYVYGSCTGVYALLSGSEVCSSITVKFIYADEAGINAADNAVKVVKTYDLQGREAASAKGLVIEKLSNGKVRKVIK